jgi:hypothetical protein
LLLNLYNTLHIKSLNQGRLDWQDMQHAYKNQMRKHSGLNLKDALERPSCRWEDITKIDLKEIRWKSEYVDWIHLAQEKGPVAASCEHSNTLSRSINIG